MSYNKKQSNVLNKMQNVANLCKPVVTEKLTLAN